jgi:hypothetical protein
MDNEKKEKLATIIENTKSLFDDYKKETKVKLDSVISKIKDEINDFVESEEKFNLENIFKEKADKSLDNIIKIAGYEVKEDRKELIRFFNFLNSNNPTINENKKYGIYNKTNFFIIRSDGTKKIVNTGDIIFKINDEDFDCCNEKAFLKMLTTLNEENKEKTFLLNLF